MKFANDLKNYTKDSHPKLKTMLNGAPGEIRTPDRLVRSQVLYPAELQARGRGSKIRTYDHSLPKRVRYQTALYPGVQILKFIEKISNDHVHKYYLMT